MIHTQRYRSAPRYFMKILSAGLLLFLSIGSLFAMPQQEMPKSSDLIIVTDMRGRKVSVPGEINSIVAIGAGSLRLLSYLDSTDKIIAVEDSGHGREKTVHSFFSLATYRLAFPGLRKLPSIGSGENHEGIIAAAPDIIISSAVDISQIDQLQNILGIPVFAVNVDVELFDTELFYNQLEILGRLLDKEERAQKLVTGLKAAMQDLENRAAEVETPKRAYAGGMMYFGPADLLRTTGDYLPFELTGTKNIMPTNPAGNLQPYMTSLEDLISATPDYVFLDAANVNLSKAGFIANRKVLEEQVPAFSNDEVYTTFVYKYYGTNWENQLINTYYAGTVLYPELYSDIMINTKAEEIWELFFGVSLDYNSVMNMQEAGPGRVNWVN